MTPTARATLHQIIAPAPAGIDPEKEMTTRNHTLTHERMDRDGRTFYRIRHKDGRIGGWAETLDSIPQDSNAQFFNDCLIFRDGLFHGGKFHGGEFHGGKFHGGVFWGGVFWDGVFGDGVFWDGMFRGGLFRGDVFHGGVFHGGEFCQSPCCASRSDGYIFVAKYVGDDLRIWAGCRNFSWKQAVAHWNDDHPDGAESQRIIHFLKAQAEDERDRWA